MNEKEIRIECGGVTRQYGKVSIKANEEVENTGLYKEVFKIAESCVHEDASNKCKVNVVDVNNSDYYNDILTPCGSSISSIRKTQEVQERARFAFEWSFVCVGILFLAAIKVVFSDVESAITLVIAAVAYLSFVLNIVGDIKGFKMSNLKKTLAIIAVVLTLYKLGIFQVIFA